MYYYINMFIQQQCYLLSARRRRLTTIGHHCTHTTQNHLRSVFIHCFASALKHNFNQPTMPDRFNNFQILPPVSSSRSDPNFANSNPNKPPLSLSFYVRGRSSLRSDGVAPRHYSSTQTSLTPSRRLSPPRRDGIKGFSLC